MSKYTTPASLFCAAALAFSASVSAQEITPPVDPVPDPALQANLDADAQFKDLDVNMDGYIEQSDLPPEHALALNFEAADSNRDSRLSQVEFDAHMNQPDDEEEEAEE